jgi:hypothetical protein
MKELSIKWVVDAKTSDGWIYNMADEHFETRADAMDWVETYRPYIGASSINYRTVEAF